MEKKLDIKELERQYIAAEENFKRLQEQFKAAKKEEEENRKAKLEAERQSRYDAVLDAYKKFEKLRTEYVDDYGYFTFETKSKKGDSHSWFWNSIGLL